MNLIHAESCGGYGWPRIWRELLARGIRVGKQRVQTLLQRHGIRAKGWRRFKVTTDSRHDLPIAPNLLNREFKLTLLVVAGEHQDLWEIVWRPASVSYRRAAVKFLALRR